MQLVQLQKAQARFRQQGLRLAAITYDNEAILKEFAQIHQIEYSLMADPQSEIIRRFGIVDPDESPGNLPEFAKKGMALPGYFVVDRRGVIKEKFFGESYYDRYTPNNVITKLFPELAEGTGHPVAAPHLQLSITQSDQDVVTGSRVTLGVVITLPKGMHIYAPGVVNYRPVQLSIESIANSPLNPRLLKEAQYPPSKVMLLRAINERVPIYEGRVAIRQDIVVLPPKEIQQRLRAPEGKGESEVKVTLAGKLKYQACDSEKCFPPAEVPVAWDFRVHPLDFDRASESIRDKRN